MFKLYLLQILLFLRLLSMDNIIFIQEMQEISLGENIQAINQLLFPLVYGKGTKDDKMAESLFKLAIQYSRHSQCILKHEDYDNEITHALTKASRYQEDTHQSLRIIFLCEYGCAIELLKESKESKIDVKIMCLEGWQTGAPDYKANRFDLVNPQGKTSLYTPSLMKSDITLQVFAAHFQRQLRQKLGEIDSKKKSLMPKDQLYKKKYTLAELEQACKYVTEYGQYFRYTSKKLSQQEIQKQKQRIKIVGRSQQVINSESDVAWYLVRAIILDLIGSTDDLKIISQEFIAGFRGFILKKATSQKQVYRKENVYKYMKCLDQLIFDYKNEVSRWRTDHKFFFKLIQEIRDNIVSIKGGELTSAIQQKQNFYDLKFNLEQKQLSKLVQIPKHDITFIAPQMKKIHSFPTSVNQRYIFEQLLNIYKQPISQKGLSTEQKEQIKKDRLDKWVLLAERSIFSLAGQLNNYQTYIDMDIHMRQIQVFVGSSSLLDLATIYQTNVRSNLYHYGMMLEGQAQSHIQLFKAILGIVAFQAVSLSRQHRLGKLSPYRVPFDISDLFSKFQSNSYEARKAMNQIKAYYQHRKQSRSPIFEMGNNKSSFYAFGRLVAQQTRQAINWIKTMDKLTTTESQRSYYHLLNQHCQAQLNYIRTGYTSYNQNGPMLSTYISNALSNLGTTNNYSVALPNNYYKENDKWLYAFLNNIPSDIMGLMHIIYDVQNPNQSGVALNTNTYIAVKYTNSAGQQLALQVYMQKNPTTNQTLPHNTLNQNIPKIQLIDNIRIYYNGRSQCSNYKDKKFFLEITKYDCIKENQVLTNQLYKFLSPPLEGSMNREHETYSHLDIKPQELDFQCYQAMCNVRSSFYTQITILCSNIIGKKIVSNSYEVYCRFAQRLVLQTGSSLAAYNKNVQRQFGKIQQLIRQYTKVWTYSDIYFCPILAPLISFLGREIIDDGLVARSIVEQIRDAPYLLSKKCLQQFQRIQQEIKLNPQLKQRWSQRYVLMAAICCFRETEVLKQQQLSFFIKLIFQLRTTKILADSETKPPNKRPFQQQLQFSVKKAIYYNIQSLSRFVKNNTQQLNEIIKTIDKGLPMDTNWYQQQPNLFQFRGNSPQTTDFYQLDIFKGIFYKNGKEISCLNDKIKGNQYYTQIFGKDRELQIYQSRQASFYQTKQNYNHFFKLQEQQGTEKDVRFQFSEGGQIFRYLVQTKQKKNHLIEKQLWTLIPRQVLIQSKCHIPSQFFQNYLAWYSEKKRAIVFRKKNLVDIYQIGMVVFLDKNSPQIIGASYITYHGNYQNQNIQEICNKDNPKYQEIVLRQNKVPLNSVKPFQVLQKFEGAQFIFQLINRKTKDRYYFLHRYQMRFKVVGGNRLLSETHYGYALDYRFMEQSNSLFNMFPCLVLEKFSKDSALLNSHRRIMILSDGIIKQTQKIHKQQKPQLHFDSFKYDIHDFFGDIRGQSRRSILHLASLMLLINDNIKIKSIQMTPLQYCMYLMRCCFMNTPLSIDEAKKLGTIFELASSDEVMLLGQSMWRMSISLKSVLPFPVQLQNEKDGQIKQKQPVNYEHLKYSFGNCRTLYQKRYNSNRIKYRQKVRKQFLRFIGEKINDNQLMKNKKISKLYVSKQQRFWNNVPIYDGNNHLLKLTNICNLFNMFETKSQKLLIWNEKNQDNDNSLPDFPKQISDIVDNNPKDKMLKEMITQLQGSYQVYSKQQQRIKRIRERFQNTLKEGQIQTIRQLQQNAQFMITQIQTLIEQIKIQNECHPDIITGIRPTISPAMYTSILCQDILLDYFPKISTDASEKLIQVIKIWLALKTRLGSFDRILLLFDHKLSEKLDCVAIMREVLSPRKDIFKNKLWLCFQAQMKLQLWSSQLQIYNTLMNGKSGSFCQLNMGEGKTQVIIPLMILYKVYSQQNKQKEIPRIILLSSLFQQARGNFFRFLSVTGFQIPCFELPFNRKVYLVKNDIDKVTDLIDAFSKKVCILMTRQSRLSQILRFHQGKIINRDLSTYKKHHIQKDPSFRFDFSSQDCKGQLIKNKVFDIFDEIDSLMNCKKSYIYSIGGPCQSKDDDKRFEIIRVCLQVFLEKCQESYIRQKLVLTDEKDEQALKQIRKGSYPLGLRLLMLKDPVKVNELRESIAYQILFKRNMHQFSFVKFLTSIEERNSILQYIINPGIKYNLSPKIHEESKPQIYLLRGLLADGILQHCFSMRCGVDFGAPNKQHAKRIAVPYQAADIPSKTSEYQQIDVSAILSFISYYTRGLTQEQIVDCLKVLLLMSKTSKEKEYKKWVQLIPSDKREDFELKDVEKIVFNSKVHKNILFRMFNKNRNTITFWLIKCVFPRDLKKYKLSITASAWDLANVSQSVGFSGTKDNRQLYSNLLDYLKSKTPDIEGTDGKMVHLITKFSKVCMIEEDKKIEGKNKIGEDKRILWKRFINQALSHKVGCIIDAGALCVGRSLRKEIVPWIAEHPYLRENRDQYLGITFCDIDGTWYVYDIESKLCVRRGTTIPDDRTFVIFDQARTRGADIKMDANVVAAFSLGPGLGKDSLMQAAGRLRKFGRSQSLIFMATQEIFSSFPGFPTEHQKQIEYITQNQKLLPKQIISYCCMNSIKENRNLLFQYAQLGWKHIYSKNQKEAYQDPIKIGLEEMYKEQLTESRVITLQNKLAIQDPAAKWILEKLKKFQDSETRELGALNNVCERQFEKEPDIAAEYQRGTTSLSAINEKDPTKQIYKTLKHHPFMFSNKFSLTSNLIDTTQFPNQNHSPQIPELYFLKIKSDKSQMTAISLRQASNFIKDYITIGVTCAQQQIFLLNSLYLDSRMINNNLEQALISAKFFAGEENYTPREEQVLLQLCARSQGRKTQWVKNPDGRKQLLTLFIKLKRTYLKKYAGSILEKLVVRLSNQED